MISFIFNQLKYEEQGILVLVIGILRIIESSSLVSGVFHYAESTAVHILIFRSLF